VVREALLRILRRDVSKSWRGAAAAELDALTGNSARRKNTLLPTRNRGVSTDPLPTAPGERRGKMVSPTEWLLGTSWSKLQCSQLARDTRLPNFGQVMAPVEVSDGDRGGQGDLTTQ